jgi:transcription elongation factor GreA
MTSIVTTISPATPSRLPTTSYGSAGSTVRSWETADIVALTPAGRVSLESELRQLHEERLPALVAHLAEAHADKTTRSEDAGLLALQQEHQRLEQRALTLERLLASAHEIVPPQGGVIALGSYVEIEEDGEREAFQLVNPCEADVAKGRISTVSPMGRALLGHRVGDAIVVEVPAGDRHVRVVSVS